MTTRLLSSAFSALPVRLGSLLFLACFTASANADWELNNGASFLNFVTTKAANVAEVHHFEQLSGKVDRKGHAQLVIELGSVNTAIPIRDERMRDMLFLVDRHPQAVLEAQVPISDLEKMKAGESRRLILDGKLAMHGLETPVASPVRVVRLADGSLQVSSVRPLLVHGKDVGLIEGIEKLREVAGLPSISQSVAVTFDLNFRES